MSSTPYMPLWVADFLAKTSDLDARETGAYLLLLMALWTRGGTLPNDEKKLQRIARCGRDWPKIWAAIEGYFEAKDGLISQPRVTLELTKARAKSEVNSNNGARGGRAKALKTKARPLANATNSLKQPYPEPYPEPEEEDKSSSIDAGDFKAISNRLFKAGGNALNRTCAGLENLSDVIGWIEQGADLTTDILPTIERIAAKAKPQSIRSWSYFRQAVADAKASRTQPMPAGQGGAERKPANVLSEFQQMRASQNG